MGKVYLIGAGPGDLKLITIKGLELIKKADVIIYDHLINEELLLFARPDAELIYAGKEASRHELPQPKINELLKDRAIKHKMVARLKGGDPFIFGRGGEEAEYLAENGIEFEVVPGVSSAISAPAYAGIPLTHRSFASTVAFVTGHEAEKKHASTIKWDELARGPDTLVFLMGIKNLREIKERLIRGGRSPLTPTCIIERGTLPEQRVITSRLGEIDAVVERKGVRPPGIILIGEVVSLREKLNWFERTPFFGKLIGITRPLHLAREMGRLIAEKGGRVLYLPTIEISPLVPNKRLSEVIDSIDRYDFIIFTSVNGVSIFFDNLYGRGDDARRLGRIRIIAIGDGTALALKSKGIIPDIIPERFTSEGIIDALKFLDIKGKTILLPRAEYGRDILPRYINDREGSIDIIPLYKTTIPKHVNPIKEGPDIVTFTSSSTVTNFIKLYGVANLEGTIIASIGPVTSKRLRRYHIDVHVEAKRHDIPGLIEALEAFLKGQT